MDCEDCIIKDQIAAVGIKAKLLEKENKELKKRISELWKEIKKYQLQIRDLAYIIEDMD